MKPVFTLFSRRTLSSLAYWLSALGYNLRDRSIANYLYFIYFCLFWSAWGIAILFMLSSTFSGALRLLPLPISLDQAAALAGQYLVTGWMLFELLRVSRRSPFILNDEDAYILCQTPVSRRQVAAALFVGGYSKIFIIAAASTVIASFTLTEWSLQGAQLVPRLFDAISSSLRALTLILPLLMGIQALLWGLGARRLHTPHTPLWIKLAFPAAVILFAASFLSPTLHAAFMSPLRSPIEAAFLIETPLKFWPGAMIPSLVLFTAGWAFLLGQSGSLNLSRAAQETQLVAAIQNATSFLQFGMADRLRIQQKLVASKPFPLLSATHGKWVLISKDVLQSWRTFRIPHILDWAILFGLALAVLIPGRWAFQMIIGAFWTIRLGILTTARLRRDLSRWWLLRSLPLSGTELLLSDLAPGWSLCVLLSWLALAFSGLPLTSTIAAALLCPFLIACAALATGSDILHRSNARVLMSAGITEENVPVQGIGGVIQGLISVLLPLGLFLWSQSNQIWPLLLVAVAISVFITWIQLQNIKSAYRSLG